MIIYFSGTGNSKWCAEYIANKTKDIAIDIKDLDNEEKIIDEFSKSNTEYLGLVFPIHGWGIPENVKEILNKVKKITSFKYIIATCAGEVGYAIRDAKDLFEYNLAYSIAMPNNYIILGDIENKELIDEKIGKAKITLEEITTKLLKKEEIYKVNQGKIAKFKTRFINNFFNKYAINTKPFWVTEQCISCELCEKSCPAKTIKLSEGKPCWGEKCYLCLSCINRCPKKAIQYGNKTVKKGRYVCQQKI